MPGTTYREQTPFWRDDTELQNFGDFLTAYFLEHLFLKVPKLPGDVRIIGSYLDDYHVGLAERRISHSRLPRRSPLVAWAGGVRVEGGFSDASRQKTEVLSVRGPLSAAEVRVSTDLPTGDPGLLIPALYSPKAVRSFVGKLVCVPHFNDDRSDRDIMELTGADKILRPAIAKDLKSLEQFIDKLASSDFALCGSLHAAIVAAAYGKSFGFWDSGRIDIPFKWRDFAASVGIPCAFHADVGSARKFYEKRVRPKIVLPSLWEALAVAPYPLRPEVLLKLLSYDLRRRGRQHIHEIARIIRIFEDRKDHLDAVVSDAALLVQSLSEALDDAERKAADRSSVNESELSALRTTMQSLESHKESTAGELSRLTSSIADLEVQNRALREECRDVHAVNRARAEAEQEAAELRVRNESLASQVRALDAELETRLREVQSYGHMAEGTRHSAAEEKQSMRLDLVDLALAGQSMAMRLDAAEAAHGKGGRHWQEWWTSRVPSGLAPSVAVPKQDMAEPAQVHEAERPKNVSALLQALKRAAARLAGPFLHSSCAKPGTFGPKKEGQLSILYFSPFPSHPDNHGNQATIQSFGRTFQKLGHRVHFALLESPIYDKQALAAMRRAWDSFDLMPNSKKLWADGSAIPFDGWYQPGLGENIRELCIKYDVDIVFCSYVFQSKLLEHVPPHVLKVIDTHDKMGNRYEMLRANGQKVEFFSCTPQEEGAYLARADLVMARRAEEARYFDSVTGKASAVVLPHVEEPRYLRKEPGRLQTVGVVASANRINLAIVLELLTEIDRRHGPTCPFTLVVAGQVKDLIPELPEEQRRLFEAPWLRLPGFVTDISEFYRSVDVVVSPVTMGTGINVKTVQAMAFGMPLLTTKVGIKGIETEEPMHNHETLAGLVGSLDRLVAEPALLQHLADASVARYEQFLGEAERAFAAMFHHPKIKGPRRENCFCGGRLEPLMQFGKPVEQHWNGNLVQAQVCSACAYVTFPLPGDAALALYHRQKSCTRASDPAALAADHDPGRTQSQAEIAVHLANAYCPGALDPVFLDLGCASGGTVREMRARGLRAFGIDSDEFSVSKGRELGNPFIFNLDPARFSSAIGIRADIAFSYHGVDRQRDVKDYLARVHALLNDGGILFYRVPNGSFFKAWMKGFQNWDWFSYPDHLHMLTPVSGTALAESAGFEVISVKTNLCGDTPEVLARDVEGVTAAPQQITDTLAELHCLRELEFVLRKPGGLYHVHHGAMAESSKRAVLAGRTVEQELKRDCLRLFRGDASAGDQK